jgi:uncharacterized protein YbcI
LAATPRRLVPGYSSYRAYGGIFAAAPEWRAGSTFGGTPERSDGHLIEAGERRVGMKTYPPEEVVPISDRNDESEGPKDPGSPGERREPPSAKEVSEEISREILRIYEESYGTGAASAEALMAEKWVIVVLDGLQLLPNEKFLVESGREDTVLQVRTQYQHAIRSSFSAAIERATGRTVVGFASTTSIEEPRFMAEVFRLD